MALRTKWRMPAKKERKPHLLYVHYPQESGQLAAETDVLSRTAAIDAIALLITDNVHLTERKSLDTAHQVVEQTRSWEKSVGTWH